MPPTSTDTSARSTRRRGLLLVAAVVVVVLAVAAVLYTVVAPASTVGGGTAAAGSAGAPVSFTATTATGGQVAVPGGKPSAVLFFSVTCSTCGPAAHALATAQQADPQRANYVAVDLDPSEPPADIAAFLATNQATSLAATSDTNGRLTSAFGVTQLSTAVFLAADGHVLGRTVEPTTAQIQDQLRAAGAS
jgi:cytochrome oxidase Cu insertion factor (SCO1/SenC/PrrC family)